MEQSSFLSKSDQPQKVSRFKLEAENFLKK